MSHDELRALVPAYAAGELEGGQADALRAHLATGCDACLRDLFNRPVGLPRPSAVPPAVAAPRRAVPAAVLLTALVAVVLALLAVRAVADLRHREVTMREDADRMALQAADDRAGLEARVRRLERELEGARAEASAQAEAARATGAENARLEEALRMAYEAGAKFGTTRPPERQLPREAPRTNSAVMTDPSPPSAVRVIRMYAVPPFRDPRGHAVWRPDRDRVELYTFDLPPLPAGAGYRVRLGLDDGRVESGPAIRPGEDGAASCTVLLGGIGERLHDIQVVIEPPARIVLVGRTDRATP